MNHADHRNVGLATLDACRDAANRWLYPDIGEPWQQIRHAYVFGTSEPTHFVDVGDWIEQGIASLQAHDAYLRGLGRDFDPESFLRQIAEFGGAAAGCELAVLWRRFGELTGQKVFGVERRRRAPTRLGLVQPEGVRCPRP